ncbi:DEAD/DEAH box helicase [Aquimonas voraii]|uniref:ATP-dependent RNA helicase DeaD n=1 Tax=Aquimonas voraii TaxID=265719 RepID=A0A1G6XWB2_9GAMM|nr:DEAD/DEAH box helicase [Aquimonas voraii]SDD82524.1 ATP-dependent RNA helicase CsdA [Aquimonas voraii]
MSSENTAAPAAAAVRFADLGLSPALLEAITSVGYETPSPIQAATIPTLLSGQDVLGQAQTGTGKTAAFALPILSKLDLHQKAPQAIVLAPTRELAIQVAEAFQRYASHMPGFHVLPIYGGQGYAPQLTGLKRGAHVVVGTPGRIIDHLERGSLDLSQLKWVVLDEADEMLRMGFIDDVESILQKTPASRQVALFSATMPPRIRAIAQTHLRNPREVTIAAKTTTAKNIRQRFWLVSGMHKLDALTRILEAETFEAMIVFARTKQATEELAEKLAARGFSAAALNGDVPQAVRERTVQKLKDGELDIIVATDVAARGLDVERISHVLNYDIPYDTESYVHRIGRTGRAGRSGEAILFVAPRERHLLRTIEKATRQPIEAMALPSVDTVNEQRLNRFRQQIQEALADPQLDQYRSVIERIESEQNIPAIEIAAALARLHRGDTPLLLPPDKPMPAAREFRERGERPERAPRERFEREERAPRERAEREARPQREIAADYAFETFRVEVGHMHGVKPGNLVGAIANEAGIESKHIGRIDIRGDHALIDLPEGMPEDLMQHLQQVWVSGQRLRIRRASEQDKAFVKPKFERGGPRERSGFDGPRKPRPAGAGFERKPGGPRGEAGFKKSFKPRG